MGGEREKAQIMLAASTDNKARRRKNNTWLLIHVVGEAEYVCMFWWDQRSEDYEICEGYIVFIEGWTLCKIWGFRGILGHFPILFHFQGYFGTLLSILFLWDYIYNLSFSTCNSHILSFSHIDKYNNRTFQLYCKVVPS